jgi:hypothetical protein
MNDQNGRHFLAAVFLLPRRPQGCDALPERFRFLGKEPPRQTLRRFQMRAAPRRD